MALPMFVFLLVVCLLLSLELLWCFDWLPLRPSSPQGRTFCTPVRVGGSQFRSQGRGRGVQSTLGPSVPEGLRAAAYQVRWRTANDVQRSLQSFAACKDPRQYTLWPQSCVLHLVRSTCRHRDPGKPRVGLQVAGRQDEVLVHAPGRVCAV